MIEKVERKIKDGRRHNGGRRQGAGRKRGIPNKITRDLKAMILSGLEAAGGQAYLEKVAKEHPAVFLTLLGKLLPLQHAGEIGGTLHVVKRTVDAPPAETREEWLARRTKELGVSLQTAGARPN
jgi:hypothetical protein